MLYDPSDSKIESCPGRMSELALWTAPGGASIEDHSPLPE